ncbi:GTP 3',8-cyclase MoaA [Sphingorhabdus arenilitoris]|uniref:GTP 3',8-cyclase n=1 Tax=Sphingorhabdus arenilitoris TaxID=1490041 RepID=A0ABV8RF36_9SPHN
MIDGFGRKIDYLRISVTDRCNFRCHYCMPENQSFLPHGELLDYTEIALLAERFISHGIRKIRLTGGEPLVRRDMQILLAALGKHVHSGRLDELTLTTNGSLLSKFSPILSDAGVRRINVSLDSLDPQKFADITRGGKLDQVMEGIAAAKKHNIHIKINMVAMKGVNEDDLLPIAHMCADAGHDLAIIETMPLGSEVGGRENTYMPADVFIEPLRQISALTPIPHRTAGPSRYWLADALGLKIGMITPLSENFCDDCNRLRLTTDGKIYMCLGSEMNVDFKTALREQGVEAVDRLLQKALRLKPERHEFEKQMANPNSRLSRTMNATGG